jgi:hypothetical protein
MTDAADDVVVIGTQDGTWYGIPREIVERHRLSADETARVQTRLDGSDPEVQAYMFAAPTIGLNVGILGGGSAPPPTGGSVPRMSGLPPAPADFMSVPGSAGADSKGNIIDDGGV